MAALGDRERADRATHDAEVAVIGLGVIGGSAALRLRQRQTALAAFSASASDRELAAAAGVPVTASLHDAVRRAGLILIAVPLDAFAAVADAVVSAAAANATILHAGSLQRPEAIDVSPAAAARVIGTHPLAGSHRTGFAAASADLFRGATVVVERRANARQREDAELFWSLAGASRIEYGSAEVHDRAMSWVSHLPQLASTALAATLADTFARESAERLAPLSGPGARDATRLAMSAIEMWQPILERAPDTTIEAVRALELHLGMLRVELERRDWESFRATWEHARAWRALQEPEGRA